MITASGRLTFSTRTDPAGLLRGLVAFVEDMQFAGIEVRVDVTLGEDGDHEDAKGREGAPGLWSAVVKQPAETFDPRVVGLVQPHVNGAGETIDWGAHVETAAALDAGSVTWRKLPVDTRGALARSVALATVRASGTRSFTQDDFNQVSPTWMPGAPTFAVKAGVSWPTMRSQWLAHSTPEAADDPAPFRAGGSGA